MSHFAVTVILPPTAPDLVDDAIVAALRPFHEFECTGTDDEFVQDVDVTEELRADFAAATRKMVRLEDGTEVDLYDDACYRDPTPEELAEIGPLGGSGGTKGFSYTSKDWADGHGYRPKIHEIPAGAEEFEKSWEAFSVYYIDWHDGSVVYPWQQPDLKGAHKYAYALVDGNGNLIRAVRRTNPNRKWDWWVVGGRWSGHFACTDPSKDMRNYETCVLCYGTGNRNDDAGRAWRESNPEYTCNGCDGKGMSLKHPTKWLRDPGDTRTKREIDFESIRARAAEKAAALYDAVHSVVAGRPIPDWEEARAAHGGDIEGARDWYRAHPVVRDIHESGNRDLVFIGDLSRFRVTRDEYLTKARAAAISTFAVLHEGTWYQRGEMGWFGMVADEKDVDTWNREFDKLIGGLPDDAILAVVDCHI